MGEFMAVCVLWVWRAGCVRGAVGMCRVVCVWQAGGVQEEGVLYRRAVGVLLMKYVEGI